jgi:hypothetical protein
VVFSSFSLLFFLGGRDVEKEVEERGVSIIFNLFQTLGTKGGRRERVAAKFVESEFEKCDRLMELFFRCASRGRILSLWYGCITEQCIHFAP